MARQFRVIPASAAKLDPNANVADVVFVGSNGKPTDIGSAAVKPATHVALAAGATPTKSEPGRSGRQEQHWCNLDARITGQGSGVVNPGKTRKANRNRPENPTPRVETPNPADMEERNPQWKTRQEPSSNNSPDGPTQ